MKTKPILFNTEMVQAILEGRKTQTRRIVKYNKIIKNPLIGYTPFTPEDQFSVRGIHESGEYGESFFKKRISKGDILWVRETFKIGAWDEKGHMAFDYKSSPEITNTPWCFVGEWYEKEVIKIVKQLKLKGIKPDVNGKYVWQPGKSPLNWKPSIFMPKQACRIWLKVLDVRVERLLDITEEDAIAEGVICHEKKESYHDYMNPKGGCFVNAKGSFYTLWESINGKDSLKANPWVWAYKFEICEMPKDFLFTPKPNNHDRY